MREGKRKRGPVRRRDGEKARHAGEEARPRLPEPRSEKRVPPFTEASMHRPAPDMGPADKGTPTLSTGAGAGELTIDVDGGESGDSGRNDGCVMVRLLLRRPTSERRRGRAECEADDEPDAPKKRSTAVVSSRSPRFEIARWTSSAAALSGEEKLPSSTKLAAS